MRLARTPLALALLVTMGAAALAGGSSSQLPKPDPALKTAGKVELESRIRRACTITQAKVQNTNGSRMMRPCVCYATRVMRDLSEPELDAYRNTGVFNATARDKALSAIDACKLQRPV